MCVTAMPHTSRSLTSKSNSSKSNSSKSNSSKSNTASPLRTDELSDDARMCQEICQLFSNAFEQRYQTVLVGNQPEPIYLPAGEEGAGPLERHRILFYQDYPRSAFHEVAHWCVAGKERRQKVDYGYWYQPDGRTSEQQSAFERVEIKPQALEWIFCKSAGLPFCISADNLSGQNSGTEARFKQNVLAQVQLYMNNGVPARAKRFSSALLAFFRPGLLLDKRLFLLEELE